MSESRCASSSAPFPPVAVALILVALVCLAYLPAFEAGFIWDDDVHLIDNPILQENGLYRSWILDESVIYYPVTFTSYWIEHRLFGLDPLVFHAGNILLHAICAVLFWRVLRLLDFEERVAILAALFFALHPLNVESVAWVTQRKNTMSMLFFLLSILAFLRFDGSVGRGVRARWLAGSLVAFILGMLSKGAIAPLPFVLILALLWRRDFGLGDEARSAPRARFAARDLWPVAPFLLVSLLLLVQHAIGQATWLGAEQVRTDSFLSRLAGAGWNGWFYLWKTAMPTGLCFVYPRWEIDARNVIDWLPALAAVAALVGPAVIWHRGGRFAREARAIVFTLVYYGLMIASSLGFMNFYYLRYSYVADHYQYYAMLGPVTLVAAGIVRGVDAIGPRARRPAIAMVAIVLVALGVMTRQRSLVYHDDETLWRDTLATNPDATIALNNLAKIVGQRGESDEALSLFLRATVADPANREAWSNAGILLEARGDLERAHACFQQALLHWPGRGGLSESEIRALSLAETHVALGRESARVAQVAVARLHFEIAAQLEPGSAPARVGLGDMMLVGGRGGEALALYREATRLAPDDPDAYERSAWVLAAYPDPNLRDADAAVAMGERAVALSGGRDAMALDALAAAYAEAGRFDDASRTLRDALPLAEASGEPDWVAEIRMRQARYARGKPHRLTNLRLR